MPYLHDIDAVGRTGRNLDVLPADTVAGPPELVALDWSQDVTLNPAHPHSEGQQLQGKGLTRTAGAQEVQVGVLVFAGIEQVNDAQRVVVPVYPQQHAGVVGHFKAGEHISRGGSPGQDVPLGLALQRAVQLEERHDRVKRCLLLKSTVADLHIH